MAWEDVEGGVGGGGEGRRRRRENQYLKTKDLSIFFE
jgi:hypothetical protein